MSKKIKVLIADDSPFIRHILSDFINSDPDLELVGEAQNGREALDKIAAQKPDVITLDYEMPVRDGISTLREIMDTDPRPVIMISSHTREGARVTLQALELGAIDFLPKPEGKSPLQLYEVREEFLRKIKGAATAFKTAVPEELEEIKDTPPSWKPFREGLKLIIIATSSGGPRALQEIMPLFPPTLPAAVIIIQHMPGAFTGPLASRLDRGSRITVRQAEDGDALRPGQVLLAPGDYHLTVNSAKKVKLNRNKPLWGVRPAADYTFLSAAPIFQENLIGVVMTGMGRDGSDGLIKVKKNGGRTLVQDEKTSTVFGMPRSAIKARAADIVLPLREIPSYIATMFIPRKGGSSK